MSDLVERLRDAGHNEMHATSALYLDAADEIKRLRAVRESIEEFSHAKSDMIAKVQAVVDAARDVCTRYDIPELESALRALDGEP